VRSFVAKLFFILYILISVSKPVNGQLFIERYRVERLDLKYFWTAGFSERQIPNIYPLRQTFVNSYLDDTNIRDNSYRYSYYLKNLYYILYGIDPQKTYTNRTRNLIERLGFREISRSFFGYNASLYQKYDKDIILSINPVFRIETVKDETFQNKNITIQSTGIESWLTWKNRIGAYVRFFDTAERGLKYLRGRQDIYGPYAGNIIVDKQSVYYDETTAYIGYSGPLFSARIGRGRHQWGPGIYHNLFLSAQHPPYNYFELRFHYNNTIFFTYLHATLDPTPLEKEVIYYSEEGKARKINHRKYLAAHRIEFLPLHWLSFGLSEAVIYGDRNIELGYLIPTNVFWSEGHDYKYDDNILWSFDTEIRFKKGLVGYGALLFDEMKLSEFGSDSPHNRAGYLGGVRWVHPLGFPRHELLIEYIRLRPFVYGHWFDINIPTHFGYPLGTSLPPNSDELRTSWKIHIRPDFTLNFFTNFQRHGSTPQGQDPVGGSIHEIHDEKVNTNRKYPFLDGKREDLREIGLEGSFRLLERVELKAVWGMGKYINDNYKRFSFGLFWNY